MSSVTSGKQMIPILNSLNVNIAVYGNHDFGEFKCIILLFLPCSLPLPVSPVLVFLIAGVLSKWFETWFISDNFHVTLSSSKIQN